MRRCTSASSLHSSSPFSPRRRGPAPREEKILNIYNWSDYIAESTVPRFEKATGITVHYDVYDSNEVLEAKLLAGRSGYDLVVPSAAPYLARQAQAGVYLPIDKSRLKNYGNLDPQLLAAAAKADPGNRFGVPYLWGTTGIGYNTALVRAALGPARRSTAPRCCSIRRTPRSSNRAASRSSTARRRFSRRRWPISGAIR